MSKTVEKKKRGCKPLPPGEKARRAKEGTAERRSRNLAIKNAVTLAGQDIGEIPPVKNPERRMLCEDSFRLFCETYFPKLFYLPWSKDLLRVIAKIERVVIDHDKNAIAMPRGSGKSTLCRAAVMWAVLKGIHRYAILIGATAPDGAKALVWFKSELTENDLLYEDFPEVCYPIRKIGNEPRRCLGQKYKGEKTNIRWGKDQIILPNIPGSAAAGSVIDVASLEGSIRGRWIRLPDGTVVRPTLAIADDPQSSESARSQGPEGQTTYRLRTIVQDVQGLAGPNQQTAILVPCTVIERGDLSDQILDRKKHPEFRGERTKRLYSWPTNKALWEEYRMMRDRAMQNDLPLDDAQEFYRERMCKAGRKVDDATECEGCDEKCMDRGAVVDWADRLDDPRNLSAVQAAMHAFYKYGAAGFAAEFQNEPLLSETAARMPTADEIMAKANGYPRGIVPVRSIRTVAFIDPGEYYHAWMVCSFSDNFTGAVVDYGTWPDQGLSFAKSKVNVTLSDKYPGTGKEGATLAGLRDLMDKLKARQFTQDGGPTQQIELCLIDTGHFPDSVHAAIRLVGSSAFKPSRGVGITAGRTQFGDYKKDRCREMGLHWWIPKESPQATIQIDTNFYKTFFHMRLATAIGDPGSFTLFGKPDDQRLFAAHVLAEYYTLPSTEKGVNVQEWHQHVGKDNELFDCSIGCMVAASRLGCSVLPMAPKTSRPVVSYAQRLAARSA